MLEALLRRVHADGWNVTDARVWKDIVKYRAGDHRRPETRNVLGLALHAAEAGCEVLAFARDRDGSREREQDIHSGIENAHQRFPVTIVGGAAIEELEAWILALLGVGCSEGLTDPKSALAESHSVRNRFEKVAAVAQADLDAIPEDAKSLRAWLASAKRALSLRHGADPV